MISGKLTLLALLLAVATTAVAVPLPALAKNIGLGSNNVLPPHNQAVAKICGVTNDKRLCDKTLKNVPSNDPTELVKASVWATEASMKRSLAFLASLRPKYSLDEQGIFENCESRLNNSLIDLEEFKAKAGKDLRSLTANYNELKNKLTHVFTNHCGCLNDIEDEKMLKVVEGGVGLGKNLSSNAMDMFAELDVIYNGFGIKTSLVRSFGQLVNPKA